jgi:ubiquinol-cytochrome c reductase core subunit 2
MGASITAAATREHLIFQVHALREFVEEATTLLAHVSTRPTYRHWELDEEVGWDLERDLEAAAECSRTQLSEALHAAAYRNTLGRSLFAPQSLVGNFEAPFLHRYVRTLWTPEHTALVGLGVPHETLIELADRFDFARDSSNERHIEEELYYPNEHEPTPAPDEKFDFFARSRYGGGERRIDNCEEVVQAALVTECAGLKDAAGSVATAVFAKCLGGVPTSVQHGSGSQISRLNVAANAALRTQHSSAFASALHLPYSDSGLIGAYVAAHKHDIAPVLSAVRARMTKFLKGGFSDDDVKVARQQLLAELQQTAESPEARLQTLASFAGVVQCTPVAGEASKAPSKPLALLTERERLALVERVGAKEVNELAHKLLSGKPTLAIVGQLNHAPFLDEIIERS